MKVEVFPVLFQNNGGLVTPTDRELFAKVQKYCLENLVERLDISRLERVWVAAEVGDDGKAENIIGIAGFTMKVDIPLFRVTDKRATVKIYERMNAFFADRGMSGQDVFLYVSQSEPEQARCPAQSESLIAFEAKPAERFAITVK